MENASKALLMAGGVLIALLVVSLLVYFYSDIKDLMGINDKVEITQQIEEFNKQYDAYYRNNLYGSDILSIVNKVYDYNRRQADDQGYQKLTMEVTFTDTKLASRIGINVKTVYNEDSLKLIIDDLQDKIDLYTRKEVVKGYTVATLSGYRTNELLDFLEKNGITSNKKIVDIQNEIKEYTNYKSALTEVKSKNFKAQNFEYDKKNGRIIKMVFVQS